MNMGYIRIGTDLLERLLKLPEGVHIEGILSLGHRPGEIGVVVSGNGLPTDGETISELKPVYALIDGDHCKFVEWKGAPG